MNLASWIILGIVIAILALAVRATFFKKKNHCGCGDSHGDDRRDDHGDGGDGLGDGEAGVKKDACAKTDDLDLSDLMCSSGCAGCSMSSCEGCATARNTLQPTYKPL